MGMAILCFDHLRAGSYTVVVEGGDYFETSRESALSSIPLLSIARTNTAIGPLSRPYTVQIYLRAKRRDGNKSRVC